ncbi:MAG: PEP-utilizing enzyme [Solirubrobacteraceae bacterium]|nr:PEP-utilizing enzyme [Solirubrobacteraceae bacterium]
MFDANRAQQRAEAGERVVLVRPTTSPADVHGFIAATGIVTGRGGRTSHAAVVARGLGIVSRVAPPLADAAADERLEWAEAIADVITARATQQEPRLVDPADPLSLEIVSHSTCDNVGAILSMLAYGIPASAMQPSSGAVELFEQAAGRDDGLAVVLRGYRVGFAEIWQIWAAHVRGRLPVADVPPVIESSTAFLHAYIDAISDRLIERWAETRRRRRQGLDVSPEDLVRKALFGAGDGDGLHRLD